MKSENKPIEECILDTHDCIRKLVDKFHGQQQADKQSSYNLFEDLIWDIFSYNVATEIVIAPLIRKYIPNGENIVPKMKDSLNNFNSRLLEAHKFKDDVQEFRNKLRPVIEEYKKILDNNEETWINLLSVHVPKDERFKAGKRFMMKDRILELRNKDVSNLKYFKSDFPKVKNIEDLLNLNIEKFKDLFDESNIEKESNVSYGTSVSDSNVKGRVPTEKVEQGTFKST